ncbi:hypothetical protein EV702DRAFT_1194630 [Suillus placidus]|uniref:Uncharacterized protein n=1 Tax=Suillus placidus TaxID=48579 RepID=A0A9P7D4F4_9AGAM|nr:hypothetical protein EV702DRAFT_1194630 [Suillus placidus]
MTDQSGNLMAFLESLTTIEDALTQGRRKKLNREKIGEFILAFDESKRVLSVIAREKRRSRQSPTLQEEHMIHRYL